MDSKSMQFEMIIHRDYGELYQHCNGLLPIRRPWPLLAHANDFVQIAEATNIFSSLEFTVVSVVKLKKW
jgi:hypothetical protein